MTGRGGRAAVGVVLATYPSQPRCEGVRLPLGRASIRDVRSEGLPRFGARD